MTESNGKPSRFTLEDWWKRNKYTFHLQGNPMYTAEYWENQQCSLEELNDWIKKQKEKNELP